MKEAVEDKKVEIKQSGTKIPFKDIDVLRLIDSSYLYGLINDSINKYNDRNMVQGFINDMVGNMDNPTMVEGNNEATGANKLGKTKPVVVHENNHGNTKLANTRLKSNNTFGTHTMEEKKNGFMDGLTSMMCGAITPINLRKRMNRKAHTLSRVTTAF